MRVAAAALSRQAAASREAEPAAVGDLYVLPAAHAWPLEWAVARAEPGPPAALLLVPADSFPLAIAPDLALAPHSTTGALVARLAHATRVDSRRLPAEWRTGRLAADEIDRLRFLLSRVERGAGSEDAGTSDPVDREAYARWCEEALAPARRAVMAAYGVGAGAPPLPAVSPSPARLPGERRPPWRSLGVAASLVAAVGLGWLTGTTVERGRLAASQRERAALDERVTQATAAERAATLHASELETQLAQLETVRRSAETPLPNVPFAWLVPTGHAVRGEEAPPLQLAPTAPTVVLLLQLLEPDPGARYRLELLEPSGRTRLLADGLVPTGVAELSLTVPAKLLPPGNCDLLLTATDGGHTRLVAHYRLRIAPGAQRQSP